MRRQLFLRAAGATCAAPWLRLAAAQGPQRIRVGLTAVILADQAAFLARWSQYLSQRLGVALEFSVRDSYQSILDLLFAGQLDAAWICGYPYVRYQNRLRLLAVPLYQGRPQYQSYLIRSRSTSEEESRVHGWADLRDKVFAYSDPLSNSGWLVAQAQLRGAGIAPGDLKRAFFAHGHRHVAEAVAARLAHAGAIDGYVWETMRLQGMSAATQTEVAWRSPLHGFPPVVAPIGPGRVSADGLRDALLAMSEDPAGRSLLGALNLDGFVSGAPELFDSIRALAESIPGSGVTG